MNPELTVAIKERLALGHTTDMICEELQQAGYDSETIEQILNKVQTGIVKTQVISNQVQLPTASSLFSAGWNFSLKYRFLVLFLAVPLLILEVVNYLSIIIPSFKTPVIAVTIGFATMLLLVVYFLLMAATLRVAAIDNGAETIALKEVWLWAKSHAIGLIWISILTFFVVWGGLLLFIIPGLVLTIYLYLSQYVYVQEGTKGMATLLRSRELVAGNWWLVVRRLVVVGLLFLCVLLGLGFVVGIVSLATGGAVLDSETGKFVTNLVGQVLSALATVMSIKIGMDLYVNLAANKPATTTTALAGRGKYIALAWLGVVSLLGFVMIVGVYGESLKTAALTPQEQFLDDAPKYDEFKQRAQELRNKEGFDDVSKP